MNYDGYKSLENQINKIVIPKKSNDVHRVEKKNVLNLNEHHLHLHSTKLNEDKLLDAYYNNNFDCKKFNFLIEDIDYKNFVIEYYNNHKIEFDNLNHILDNKNMEFELFLEFLIKEYTKTI